MIDRIIDYISRFFDYNKIKEEYPSGQGVYNVFDIDLSIARDDKKYTFYGDRLIVQHIDNLAYLRLNHMKNDLINLGFIRSIKTPFKYFYVTNEATTGTLKLLAGSGGMFDVIQANISTTIDGLGNIFNNIGNDELASRIGNFISYDKQGSVFWWDSFEGGVNRWSTSFTGAGSVTQSNTYCKTGENSMKILTGNAVDDISTVTAYLPYHVISKLGFEFCVVLNSDDYQFYLTLIYYTGSKKYTAEIYLEPTTGSLRYKNSVGGYSSFGNCGVLRPDVPLFHFFKLIIDPITGKYDRLLINEQEFDLSDINIVNSASATGKSLEVSFRLKNNGVGQSCDTYIDNVIVTKNEP